MGRTEINVNLRREENYENFSKYVKLVIRKFNEIFGEDTMAEIDLYIDNGTRMTGHTPTIIPIVGKYLLIKLGVDDFNKSEKIVYQLAHEMCHYLYYVRNGIDVIYADNREENICSAMSLVFIKIFFPDELESWVEYVDNLEEEKYNKGGDIARSVDFDPYKLKEIIWRETGKKETI